MPKPRPIPEGYHSVTPFLVAQGAARLIDFLKQAFDAQELERVPGPGGTVRHAELKIGDSRIMISEASGEAPPMPTTLYLYVKDMDEFYRRAVGAGATSVREPVNQFYGDRNATVRDPAGNQWLIATHVEDVSTEEMQRRMAAQPQRAAG